MQQRKLGRTDLMVSPIAIGGAAFAYIQQSSDWNPLSDDGRHTVYQTMHRCLDLGINYVDTAPAYGKGYSESLVGHVMKTRRDDCVLASKVWYELDDQGVIESVHESLKRLQTDHIDIMQIHGRMYTPADVEHILHGGPLDALQKLKQEGKIRYIGITTEEPWTVIPFLEQDSIDVYQIAYNLIYQAAARHFLIEASKVNAGVVSMRTMTSGVFQREASFLAPQWTQEEMYDMALKFVLSDSRIHAGIVGMRWPNEVEHNVRILESWTPPIDFATMPRLTFEIYKAGDANAS